MGFVQGAGTLGAVQRRPPTCKSVDGVRGTVVMMRGGAVSVSVGWHAIARAPARSTIAHEATTDGRYQEMAETERCAVVDPSMVVVCGGREGESGGACA